MECSKLSVCLDRDHWEILLRSRIRQGKEHEKVAHRPFGLEIGLVDPEPVSFVTDGREGITGFVARTKDPELCGLTGVGVPESRCDAASEVFHGNFDIRGEFA